MLYFDHNATTPLDERVLAAMLPYLQQFYGNPSTLYRLGRASRSAIENARLQVAVLVGVSPEQVIFTSGGTEANNLAINQIRSGSRLVVSAMEHPSVMTPALAWQAQGNALTIVDVDAQGLINPSSIDRMDWQPGDMLSLQAAHNETGVIQDLSQYAERLRAKQVIVHTDAVQALGKIGLDFSNTHAHLMSLSSHKIYGPKGCGALIIEKGFNLRPLVQGGGQEHGFRSGTESVANIVGFGKAAELARLEWLPLQKQLLDLRIQLEQGLKKIPGMVIFAEQADRLPNTVQWGMSEADGEMLLMQLDRKGIAVSSGSACSSGGGKPSPSLIAMGVAEKLAKSAIRISLGKDNTSQDINQLLNALQSLLVA